MKHRKTEVVLVGLTAVFIAFLAGYFLGRNNSGEFVIETQTAQTVQAAVQETQAASAAARSGDSAETAPSETEAAATEKININTATEEELMTLPGIGEVRARAIIAYRTQIGAFVSVEQLTDVDGIGEKTLEKIRDRITVG